MGGWVAPVGESGQLLRSALGTAALVAVLLGATWAGGTAWAAPSPSHPGTLPAGVCVIIFAPCYITLSTPSGSHGNPETVKAVGYYPGEPYTVYFGGPGSAAQVVATGLTGTGSFSASFRVPSDPVGKCTVYVTDLAGDNQSAPFSLTHMTATPNHGAPGNTSRVRGQGFLPNATMTFRIDGKIAKTSVPCITNGYGNFSNCVLTIPTPKVEPKAYVLVATDGTNIARVAFTVT